jgi:hypothetical protein
MDNPAKVQTVVQGEASESEDEEEKEVSDEKSVPSFASRVLHKNPPTSLALGNRKVDTRLDTLSFAQLK